MKQLGNLAIVCANRPEVLMQIYGGKVAVLVGAGPDRAVMFTTWDDDAEITRIIHDLNFGKYKSKEGLSNAA